jgi:hypothetical protein
MIEKHAGVPRITVLLAFLLSAVLITSVIFVPDASATQVGLTVSSDVFISDGTQQVFDVGLNPGPNIGEQLSVTDSHGVGSTSSLQATVAFGAFDSVLQASTPVNGFAASSDYDGAWEDTLVPTSNGDLLFTVPYNISMTCSGATTRVQTIVAFDAGSQHFSPSSNNCNSALQGTIQFVESVVAGQILQLEGQLIQSATADNGGGSVLIDPSVNFYIDPITPGLTYTTGSGASYLSPTSVPEPGTLSLLVVGLGGLLFSRHRLFSPKVQSRLSFRRSLMNPS